MNWDSIEQLLNIADKARQWPNLKGIHDAAMAELHKHQAPQPAPASKPAKPAKEPT